MQLTEIDKDVFVCRQITENAVDDLAKAGFKTIICNRPDSEEQNQPSFSTIEKRAEKCGIKTYYIPVTPSHIEAESIRNMADALKKCPRPVVAYCKSGNRAAMLYNLAKK